MISSLEQKSWLASVKLTRTDFTVDLSCLFSCGLSFFEIETTTPFDYRTFANRLPEIGDLSGDEGEGVGFKTNFLFVPFIDFETVETWRTLSLCELPPWSAVSTTSIRFSSNVSLV